MRHFLYEGIINLRSCFLAFIAVLVYIQQSDHKNEEAEKARILGTCVSKVNVAIGALEREMTH